MQSDWSKETLEESFGVSKEELDFLWDFLENSPPQETIGETVKRFLDLNKSEGLNFIFFLSLGEYIGRSKVIEEIVNNQTKQMQDADSDV